MTSVNGIGVKQPPAIYYSPKSQSDLSQTVQPQAEPKVAPGMRGDPLTTESTARFAPSPNYTGRNVVIKSTSKAEFHPAFTQHPHGTTPCPRRRPHFRRTTCRVHPNVWLMPCWDTRRAQKLPEIWAPLSNNSIYFPLPR